MIAALVNSLISVSLIGGIGYWIFCLANGSPASWRRFRRTEQDPVIRLGRWRARIEGYFILTGFVLGYSLPMTFTLFSEAFSPSKTFAYEPTIGFLGMTIGGFVGLVSGHIYNRFVRELPFPSEEQD
jgi:hypothetical protein